MALLKQMAQIRQVVASSRGNRRASTIELHGGAAAAAAHAG